MQAMECEMSLKHRPAELQMRAEDKTIVTLLIWC